MADDRARPKDLPSRVAFLEGEVKALHFIAANLLRITLSREKTVELIEELKQAPSSGSGSMQQRGYINSFARVDEELREMFDRPPRTDLAKDEIEHVDQDPVRLAGDD